MLDPMSTHKKIQYTVTLAILGAKIFKTEELGKQSSLSNIKVEKKRRHERKNRRRK